MVLFDSNKTSDSIKQDVCETVTHELAHQVSGESRVHFPERLLRYVQTEATTSNTVGPTMQCVRLHVAQSLTGFKLCTTTPYNTEQHATGCANGHSM